MKKIVSVLCLLMLGTGVGASAHEDEGGSALNYSVYQSYRYLQGNSAAKMLATQQQAKTVLPGWSATPDKLTGMFRDMYGPAAVVPGNTNMQKAHMFMTGKLSSMGVNANEWKNTRDIAVNHASYVDFEQVVVGHKVVFSTLSFRFTTDGRLQRVKMQNFGMPEAAMVPVISANDVLNGTAITQGMAGMSIDKKEIEADWVWFPIPTNNGYVIHPAWAFHIMGIGGAEMPFDLTGYVDAITGELLYRSNSVNETFDVTVKADVHLATPASATTQVPMADMRVSIGSNNYVTNDTGFVSIATANAPVTVTYPVRGPWANVRLGSNTVSFSALMTTSPSTYVLPIQDTTTTEFRAVSAFYHVNKVHDYMKSHWPAFTGMDGMLATNVDLTSGQQCNAFYNNGAYSINFYPPQNSCRAFSIVSDIVYHEYGHGISYRFYSANGANFSNGAMGEANSDVWAMCINRDGIVGDGAYYNGGNIRSYLGTPKVYPGDIRGEVHADGEIVAGAWWDVAVNTGSVDTMAKLFALTHYDLPNGPNGTEGQVYHDVLISALMNDDDDANLGNGTPHFTEIVHAFARHGIYLLSDATVEHTEVPHQPVGTPVTVTGKLTLTNPAFFDKMYLHFRNRVGNWDSVIMVNTTGNEYTAQIPGFPAGTIVDYYFNAEDIITATSFGLPRGFNKTVSSIETTLPYQYGVGINHQRYKFDFESSIDGWELGVADDDATTGVWIQDIPVGSTSNSLPVQPGNDVTTGTGKCLVTGNASSIGNPSLNDVDNGKTTVQTPYFDLPFHDPVIEYYRWYSNDRGATTNSRNDTWLVEMRPPGSQLWKRVDYTKESDQKWRRRIFKISEYYGSGVTSVQFRFIAEDRVITTASNSGQNVIEAAIDDFIIYESAPLGVDNTNVAVQSIVYPNPADDIVNVTVPGGARGSITLYDITGRAINTQTVTEGTTNYVINTANIPAGAYMVLVQTQFAVQNTKVVISHK